MFYAAGRSKAPDLCSVLFKHLVHMNASRVGGANPQSILTTILNSGINLIITYEVHKL